ncbi:MAG: sugar transferase [Thermodesulfobacteriota bacterium]
MAKATDLAVVCCMFMISLTVSANSFVWSDAWASLTRVLLIRVTVANVLLFGAYLLFCTAIFSSCGFYRSHRLSRYTRRGKEILVATTVLAGMLLVLRRPLDLQFASDKFLLLFWILTSGALGLSWVVGQQALYFVRLRGRNLRHVIIVGEEGNATALADRVTADASLGYQVARTIAVWRDRENDRNIAAALNELQALVTSAPIDEVFVALPLNDYREFIEAVVRLCEEQGIIVRVWAEMFNLRIARPHVDELDGVPVVTVRSGPQDDWHLIAKRAIDIVGSVLLLFLLAPLFVVVAALIKLDSPGPVFFRQERVGLNKRRFWLIKFRTMHKEAERQQQQLEHLNEASGPVFKIRQDPRVTRLGKFLRRFSIDELPQLFNVLKGDMSLVGPRPLPVRDVEHIDRQWHKRRFSVKPGLTCLWQVNGRSNISFDDWVRMDLEYIDTWSLGLDMKILMKTIPVVLRGEGAY